MAAKAPPGLEMKRDDAGEARPTFPPVEAQLPGGCFMPRPQTTPGRPLLPSAIGALQRGNWRSLAVWVMLENGGGTGDRVT